MNLFRAHVRLNFTDGTPDDEIDRRAVRFLEFVVRKTAANSMRQLLSGTLQLRTKNQLAELDLARVGIDI